ncbi:hypothetical protein PPL_06540 [Heterostelium album PN500]|uniref:Uncharacterized protein n=1 Tax=Heterostelium pallidum (strain ATCC 26659 / Pp 5 / PN500) TaxID=670386 RepID=D3BDF7_HETP5|nr:hypothetical protein PPL_06540 [Heterostelium album PN500]EFA80601.1 hypothetical protein PPL_06540 [Heterostelium album PN500]|eukprot:XP_020432721.1 hypothetical protein PPL_06540 [Heterostelium album PN500]
MEPINDPENQSLEPSKSTAKDSPKSPSALKKDDKKRDDENEKKKQSFMAHWKYKPGPNASVASLYIYNNMTLGNNVPPPNVNSTNNNSSSNPQTPISQTNNSPPSTTSVPMALSPKLTNSQSVDSPPEVPNSPEFKKGRRNSTPNMNNFITHWKFDPRAQQKQQRQQQLIGHHQQQMYMKRMSNLNLNIPSSPEIDISNNSPQQQQQQQLEYYNSQQQQVQHQTPPRTIPTTYFHPYSGRPRAPSIGTLPSSPRYEVYSTSPPPPEMRTERRMSLPNVPYGQPPVSPKFYYQQQQQQQQPQQPQNPPFTYIPPSSPLSSSSTPRNIYLDTIPEVPTHQQYIVGSEYSSVTGSPITSPYILSNTPSPPYSPVFAPNVKIPTIQSPTQSSIVSSRRMSAPLLSAYEEQPTTTTTVYRQAQPLPPSFIPQHPFQQQKQQQSIEPTKYEHAGHQKSHQPQLQQSQQNPPQHHQSQQTVVTLENKLPSMRDLLNNLNIHEQQQQRINEQNPIFERKEDHHLNNNNNESNNDNDNDNKNNSKMCIINLVQ